MPPVPGVQGVQSPLAGQVFLRATMVSTFGAAKRWLAEHPHHELKTNDYYKVGTGPLTRQAVAANASSLAIQATGTK